ncbi:hypothetical protein AMJ57_02495 [Parcubacteria bacterium SG8_24]|nr:MAG: hypothetical protein AMJ57_02495 [Parcubacteria bacterium SG8_24]
MFTKAIYEAIREAHRQMNARLETHNLKGIGFLGGREGEPAIVDIRRVTRTAVGTFVEFQTLFPKTPTSNRLLKDQVIGETLTLLMDADGRPSDGTDIDVRVGDLDFRGTVRHIGDQWHIDWRNSFGDDDTK